jgi:hypothetical protein
MRPLISLSLIALLGSWFIGCSSEEPVADRSMTLLSLEQVQPLEAPVVAGKASHTDEIDFQMILQPNRQTVHANGSFRVMVPRSAVGETTTITGDWLGDHDPGYFGIDFGPAGLEFLRPIEMWVRIPAWVFEDYDPARLCVVHDREDGSYEVVPSQWNWRGGSWWLTGEIEHFSKYLVAVGPPPDNGSN